MCFRPPTVEEAKIKCPQCGSDMPMDAPKCPACGAANAVSSAAPPSIPTIPGAPKAPGAPRPAAPGAPAAPAALGAPVAPGAPIVAATAAPTAAAEQTGASAAAGQARGGATAIVEDTRPLAVPQVGGRIRTPKGDGVQVAQNAPEAPTGPGFTEAPDISNTGNYFIDAHYNNG